MLSTASLRSIVSVAAALLAALVLGGAGPAAAQQLSSPAEHIGHERGAARSWPTGSSCWITTGIWPRTVPAFGWRSWARPRSGGVTAARTNRIT